MATFLDDPVQSGLLQFGLAMMAGAGPSPYKQSLASIAGKAGMAGTKAYKDQQEFLDEMEQRKIRRKLLEMQTKKIEQDVLNETQMDKWISDPANLMAIKPPQSAVGDYGPGEAPTVGSQESSMQPKNSREIALSMMRSGNPLLAKMAFAQLAKPEESGLRTVGNDLYNERTGQWVPKPAVPQKPPNNNTLELIAARNALPEGHPDRKVIDDILKKQGEFSPVVPNFTILQTEKGPVAVNTRTGKPEEPMPGIGPRLKDANPTDVRFLNSQVSFLDQIDEAIKAVEANRDAFGLKYMMPDEVNARMDPAGVSARAKVANIGSLKVLERSGATVTVGEAKNIKPFIPYVYNDADAIIKKLNNMRAEITANINPVLDEYTEERGFKVPSAAAKLGRPTKKNIQERKTRNGKSYVKIDGKWYEE